jgi:cation transport ATPase-like protein
VHRRLAEFGPNTVSEEESSRWRTYLAKFWSPIPWLHEAAILTRSGATDMLEQR